MRQLGATTGRALLGVLSALCSAADVAVAEPILQSTYLGGSSADSVDVVAIDPRNGDILVAGHTFSTNLPHTAGGAQPQSGGGVDGFVARFDSTLTTLRQATYLGGSDGEEILGLAIAPATGDVYVAGFTTSADFPGTAAGAQPAIAGLTDGFVAHLDPTLTSLRGATYFGGTNTDKILGVSVHPSSGEVFVAGQTISSDLPGTAGGQKPDYNADLDGFVARFDPSLATLNQATYLFVNRTILRAMTIDPSTGDVLVGGHADSAASFLARFDRSLRMPAVFADLNVSMGQGDLDLFAIAVDPRNGDVLGAGWTTDPSLLYAGGAAQPQPGGTPGSSDAVVLRLDPTLAVWKQSTYFGGSDDDYAYGIDVHPATGDVYITGETLSVDLPGVEGGHPPSTGLFHGFVARLDSTLTLLDRAAYYRGSGDDTPLALAIPPRGGVVLVAGTSTSADLPGTECTAPFHYAGGSEFGGDGFVTLLGADLSAVTEQPCSNDRAPIEVGSRPGGPRTVARSAGAMPASEEPKE